MVHNAGAWAARSASDIDLHRADSRAQRSSTRAVIWPGAFSVFGLFVWDRRDGSWQVAGDNSGLYKIFYDAERGESVQRIGTSFLLGEESGYSYSVVRKKERQKISRVSTGSAERPNYQYQSLSHGVRDKHMETFVITLSPGAGSPELSRHDGEEFLLVMEGSIRVILGDKEEVLNEGDSIYYHATVPHNVLNAAGRDNAVIMAVLYTG